MRTLMTFWVLAALAPAIARAGGDGDDFSSAEDKTRAIISQMRAMGQRRQANPGAKPGVNAHGEEEIPLAVPDLGWPDTRAAARLAPEDADKIDDILKERFPVGMSSKASAKLVFSKAGYPALRIDFDEGAIHHSWALASLKEEFLYLYTRRPASAPEDGYDERISLTYRGYERERSPHWARMDYISIIERQKISAKTWKPEREKVISEGTLFSNQPGMGSPPDGEVWKPMVDLGLVERKLSMGANALRLMQEKDGSWSVGPKAISSAADNAYVRVGITAIVAEALERMGMADDAAVKKAYEYIEANGLKSETWVNTGTINDRLYALAYGLAATLKLKAKTGQAKYDGQAKRYIQEIRKAKSSPGGLDYEKGNPDGPATFQLSLLALSLLDARDEGCDVPKTLIDGFLSRLSGARTYSGGFGYHVDDQGDDDAADAAARSVLVEYVLYRGGRSGQTDLKAAVDRFLRYRKDIRRALDTAAPGHAGPHRWAKYYYLFGVYWSARAANELNIADADALPLVNDLGGAVQELESKDFMDSPDYAGPAYGLATSISAVRELRAFIRRQWPDLR